MIANLLGFTGTFVLNANLEKAAKKVVSVAFLHHVAATQRNGRVMQSAESLREFWIRRGASCFPR